MRLDASAYKMCVATFPSPLNRTARSRRAGPRARRLPDQLAWETLSRSAREGGEQLLQFWPECAEIMLRVVDFQTRRVPIMACKSAIELFELDNWVRCGTFCAVESNVLTWFSAKRSLNPLARLVP